MSHFLGTHQNRIDAKGRVSIPAPFRTALRALSVEGAAPLVLRPSHNHACVEGWPACVFASLANPLDRLDMFGADHDDLAASVYADAYPVESDKEGRIVLPDGLMHYACLSDTVTFMGLGRTFQIWEPQAAQRRLAEARGRAKSRGLTLPGAIPLAAAPQVLVPPVVTQ
jgi:MraZ protein